MRLTSREFLLLGGFLAVVLGGFGVIGLRGMGGWAREVERARSGLELELARAELALVEEAGWLERGAWLEEWLPPFVTAGEAVGELLEVVQETVEGEGAALVGQPVLLEGQMVGGLHAARVSFGLGGELGQVLGALHELGRPEGFRAVEELRLRPDEDGATKVLAEVRLRGYYRMGEGEGAGRGRATGDESEE